MRLMGMPKLDHFVPPGLIFPEPRSQACSLVKLLGEGYLLGAVRTGMIGETKSPAMAGAFSLCYFRLRKASIRQTGEERKKEEKGQKKFIRCLRPE